MCQANHKSFENKMLSRTSRTLLVRSFATSSTKAAQPTGSFVAADQTLSQFKLYHKSHFASLALVPIALIAHPSALSMPLDIALAVVLPVHAHVRKFEVYRLGSYKN